MLLLSIHYEYLKFFILFIKQMYMNFYSKMFTKPVFHLLINFLNQFYQANFQKYPKDHRGLPLKAGCFSSTRPLLPVICLDYAKNFSLYKLKYVVISYESVSYNKISKYTCLIVRFNVLTFKFYLHCSEIIYTHL